jgi:predicted dehydrogenase
VAEDRLEPGLDVWVDKPVAASIADAEAMIDKARKANLMAPDMVSQWSR